MGQRLLVFFFFTMGLEVLQKKKKKNRLPQLEPQTLIFRTSVQTSHFLDECAIHHAMLKLRAFLLLKGISCYSGVMVAHSSRKWEVCGSSPSCGNLVLFWSTLGPMDKKPPVVFDPPLSKPINVHLSDNFQSLVYLTWLTANFCPIKISSAFRYSNYSMVLFFQILIGTTHYFGINLGITQNK